GALVRAGLGQGLEAAVDGRLERQRHELRDVLALAGDTDIVWSPSGTDATLHAIAIARAVLGTPLVSVVAAADETGSGVAYASCGKHFNSRTAQGAVVEKGDPIRGLADDMASVAVPLRDANGGMRSPAQMDEAVTAAVSRAASAGSRVLLHAMDHSKLGGRCPSLDCLRRIRARWGAAVQIVIDACQMRLGRRRLAWHLGQGHLVLVTGSKFFTGPPFCGALLVPASLSVAMAGLAAVPPGLGDYTGRSDWPRAWQGVRAMLPERVNLGQLLRWTAALEEMQAYFAVPEPFRTLAFARFAAIVPELIAGHADLSLLPDGERSRSGSADGLDDGEMATRTIFPFTLRRGARLLSPAEAQRVYRALNEDVAAILPPTASVAERQLAARLCHIGQPVEIPGVGGDSAAALRISAGARIVSENWSDAGEAVALRNLQREFAQIRTILDKVDLLLRNLAALEHRALPPTPKAPARATG
ncbi:MAG TPA: hypothetical protein VJO12_12930, partial [Stellaceae bacterium]|nr:hypothetical protein [Stellaceae bacterium]